MPTKKKCVRLADLGASVRTLHEHHGLGLGLADLDAQCRDFRGRLLREELAGVEEAQRQGDLVAFIQELGDVLVVTCGTLVLLESTFPGRATINRYSPCGSDVHTQMENLRHWGELSLEHLRAEQLGDVCDDLEEVLFWGARAIATQGICPRAVVQEIVRAGMDEVNVPGETKLVKPAGWVDADIASIVLAAQEESR